MVSFIILLIARTARIACPDRQTERQNDRQNDTPSTVTLAAHARRGLIIYLIEYSDQLRMMISTNQPFITQCYMRYCINQFQRAFIKRKLTCSDTESSCVQYVCMYMYIDGTILYQCNVCLSAIILYLRTFFVPSLFLSVCLSVCLSISLCHSACLSACPSVHLSVCLCLYVRIYVCISVNQPLVCKVYRLGNFTS